MKVSYKDLNNQELIKALQYLSGQVLPSKTAYKVSKITKSVKEKSKEVGPQYRDLVRKYMKDPTQEMGQDVEIDDTRVPEFQKEREALMDNYFEIAVEKITLRELERVNMTPDFMEALEPFLTEIELVGAAQNPLQ